MHVEYVSRFNLRCLRGTKASCAHGRSLAGERQPSRLSKCLQTKMVESSRLVSSMERYCVLKRAAARKKKHNRCRPWGLRKLQRGPTRCLCLTADVQLSRVLLQVCFHPCSSNPRPCPYNLGGSDRTLTPAAFNNNRVITAGPDQRHDAERGTAVLAGQRACGPAAS